MRSFFESEGQLKVVVSKGVISTYEVNTLEKGKYVYFMDRECGQPCSLYFNDRLVGYCEIIIIDNIFAARMVKVSNWAPETVFSKTLLEDSEILNSELVLGERPARISDVNRLTVGSTIPFNTVSEYVQGSPMSGKLIVSGIEAGTGKIIITEENWALEIEETIFKTEKNIPRRDSFLPFEHRTKYYDFSRPDCVTRSHVSSFSRIHQFFGNYIGGEVKMVDQMTWGELKDEYKGSGFLQMVKEEIKSRNIDQNHIYYLPLDSSEEDEGMDKFFKDYAVKCANDQLMERVGVVYNSENIRTVFKNDSVEIKSLLEASWRDKIQVSFGQVYDDESVIEKSKFVEDWEMIVIVKMSVGGDEMVMVYPLAYFIQIINELK